MRIKIINPNTSKEMTDSIHQTALSCAAPDTEIVTVCPDKGPVSIENHHDQIFAAVGVALEVHKGVKDGFDAYVIAAACDAGIEAAKEIADAPAIGIGEASMHMASLVAYKFSIVTMLPRIKPLIEGAVKRAGLEQKCVSIRTAQVCVLDCEEKPDLVRSEMIKEAKKAIDQDGAEAICLGCSGMTSFVDDLEREVDVPIFDGVVCAVKLAEAMINMKKTTSKKLAYQKPTKKEYKGYSDQFSF